MAERRMFAKTIVLSDVFLDMPLSARCLYFTLGMFADDDGFVNSPKGIMRQCGASQDDMNILISKKFILVFDSGVIVIRDWRINNYLRNDRYQETKCIEEKNQLDVDEKGSYFFGIPSNGIPNSGIPSIGKDSIDKDSIDNNIRAKSSDVNAFFDSIWNLYPKKKGKGQVSDAKKKKLYDIGYDEISRCIERYKSYIESEHMDEQFIMHGSTFFNSGYVDYLDTNCDDEDAQNNVRKYPDSWSEEDIRIFESAQVTTRR